MDSGPGTTQKLPLVAPGKKLLEALVGMDVPQIVVSTMCPQIVNFMGQDME